MRLDATETKRKGSVRDERSSASTAAEYVFELGQYLLYLGCAYLHSFAIDRFDGCSGETPARIRLGGYCGRSERPSNSELNRISSASAMAIPSVGYSTLTSVHFTVSEAFMRLIRTVA